MCIFIIYLKKPICILLAVKNNFITRIIRLECYPYSITNCNFPFSWIVTPCSCFKIYCSPIIIAGIINGIIQITVPLARIIKVLVFFKQVIIWSGKHVFWIRRCTHFIRYFISTIIYTNFNITARFTFKRSGIVF